MEKSCRPGNRTGGLKGTLLVGLLVPLLNVCCVAQEFQSEGFSQLNNGDVHVRFVAVFSEATYADLPRDVASFQRVFKIELGRATEVSELAIETKPSSPPLTLEGRAVFRHGESRRLNLPHTDEGFKFSTDLQRVAVRNAVKSGLEDRKYDLGPLEIKDVSPPTVVQDVRVVIPKDQQQTTEEAEEPFFQRHPEVLTTVVVLLVLLASVLIVLCWWILREKSSRNYEKGMTGIKVDKTKTSEGIRVGGEKNVSSGKAAKSLKDVVSDEKKLSQLASKNKVEFETLEFIGKIGKGSFKTVFRGRWGSNSVAIVRMRKGGVLVEARVMQKLSSHPNLVTFYRWTRDTAGNEYIVMELLPLGSLDVVLRKSGDKMKNKAKVDMCAQICQAMCQLAEENVLHRDLAARNVLVQSLDPVTVKVSDFGLAKYLNPGISSSSNILQHLPVRWIPPEVMEKQEWSEKSDVWAFGVTMWEIFSNSREPYAAEWPSDEEVVHNVRAGRRLPKPENCPESMYHMMLECWHEKPLDRPDFKELCRRFKAPCVVAGARKWKPLGNSKMGCALTRAPAFKKTGADSIMSTAGKVDDGLQTTSPVVARGEAHISGSENECCPRSVGASQRSESCSRRLDHRKATRIARKEDKVEFSAAGTCESVSSIPDPEFYIESDMEDSTRDASRNASNSQISGSSYSHLGHLHSRGLIPVEIESSVSVHTEIKVCGKGGCEGDNQVGYSGGKSSKSKSPYADIGELV